MNERARSEIQADLAALAGRRRRRLGAALLLSLGASVGLGFGLGLAPFDTSPVLFGLLLVALGTLSALALALGFGLMFPRPATVRAGVIGLVAGGLASIAGIASRSPGPTHGGWGCLAEGTGFAFAGLLVLWLLGRDGLLRRHGPVGTWLGLGAALAVVPMLQIACPDRSFEHLLIWHGGILAAGIGLAGVLRRLLPGLSGTRES